MHDGVWDRGDYIPLLFFKFSINFYEKIGPRGKWIYSRNILNFIFLFLDDHVNYTKIIIILYAPRYTSIYKNIL